MRVRSTTLALTVAVLAGGVLAQDAPKQSGTNQDAASGPEADTPKQGALGSDDAAGQLEKPPTSGKVYRAVGRGDGEETAIPGVALPDYRPAVGSLLPEGTYLLRRRGIVVPVGEHRWAFVFDQDAQGHADPPMFLLPSQQLSEMVRLVKSRAETVTFFVDGEVFVYDEHNDLLPIRYDVGAEKDHSHEEETRAALDANKALRPDDKNPSVESLMQRLERATGQEGERSEPSRPSTAPQGGAETLLPEQTPLISARGRLVRAEQGWWAFVPDNDADAGAGEPKRQGHAFILEPCLNTQELERLAERYADRVAFVVSGAIFVFDGRNYLLPTMYLVETNTDGNLTPAQ